MVGPKYVWIMVGWYDDKWWRTGEPDANCTVEEMNMAAEGYMAVGDMVFNPSMQPGIARITSQQFLGLYNDRTNRRQPHGSNLVSQTYDAIWAMALALNETETQLTMHTGKVDKVSIERLY